MICFAKNENDFPLFAFIVLTLLLLKRVSISIAQELETNMFDSSYCIYLYLAYQIVKTQFKMMFVHLVVILPISYHSDNQLDISDIIYIQYMYTQYNYNAWDFCKN